MASFHDEHFLDFWIEWTRIMLKYRRTIAPLHELNVCSEWWEMFYFKYVTSLAARPLWWNFSCTATWNIYTGTGVSKWNKKKYLWQLIYITPGRIFFPLFLLLIWVPFTELTRNQKRVANGCTECVWLAGLLVCGHVSTNFYIEFNENECSPARESHKSRAQKYKKKI